jgi:predicted GNAT family acetyltransferase
MDEALEIAYDPVRSRVEGRRDGVAVGVVEFGLRADAAVLAYTEVDEGHAEPLLDAALALLRARGFRIVPLCPLVRAFLHAHPERLAGVDTRFLDPVHPRRADPVVVPVAVA